MICWIFQKKNVFHKNAVYLSLTQKHDSYLLTIKGTDMDGAPSGNTGTTQVKIQVVDINDNIPVLEKDEVKIY